MKTYDERMNNDFCSTSRTVSLKFMAPPTEGAVFGFSEGMSTKLHENEEIRPNKGHRGAVPPRLKFVQFHELLKEKLSNNRLGDASGKS